MDTMVWRPESLENDFKGCVAGMLENLSLWKTLQRELLENVDRTASAIESNTNRSVILIKLKTVANIIAAMHKSEMDVRVKRAMVRGNPEARKIAVDALSQLDTFVFQNFRVHAVNENRLKMMLEQDRIDRGGRMRRRDLIGVLVTVRAEA